MDYGRSRESVKVKVLHNVAPRGVKLAAATRAVVFEMLADGISRCMGTGGGERTA